MIDFSLHCSKISKFTNLKKIYLNYMKHANLKQIKGLNEFLTQIKNLNQLGLMFRHCNDIEEESLSLIAQSLSFQNNLKGLFIDFYFCSNLKNDHVKEICQIISKNHSLKKICFQMGWNKNITQQSLDYLTNILKEKVQLKELDLSFEYLKNIESINGLNESLLCLSNLRALSLCIGGCKKITTNEINKLFEILKNLKQLNNLYIDVYSCNLNDESINILANSLSKCESISILGIDLGDQHEIKSMKQLGSSISLMPSLQQLQYYLYYSIYLVDGPFGFYTKNNNKLEKLNIILDECESLSSQSLKSITSDLSCLSNLNELTISLENCANTNQEFYECLSQSIQHLSSLVVVKFNKIHQIDKNNIYALLNSLMQIQSLRQIEIILSNNNSNLQNNSKQIRQIQNYLYKFKRLVFLNCE
ncbi:hypothetical protein ABPG74_013139 [Tetrahymena malaccensis]